MIDFDDRRKRFADSLETLRLELVRAFGSPHAVPLGLRDAYLEAALSGLAVAEAMRSAVDVAGARVKVLRHVKVLEG